MDDSSGSTPPASPIEMIDLVEVQRSFIKARQNAIERLGEEIRDEQERTKICIEAIAELEAAITEDRGSLKGLEEKLTNLLAEQEKVKKGGKMPNQGFHPKAIGRRNQKAAQMLDHQIKKLRKMVEETVDGIQEYRNELENWRHLRTLSSAVINYLMTTKGKEEVCLPLTQLEGITSNIVDQLDRGPGNIVAQPNPKPETPNPETTTPEEPEPRILTGDTRELPILATQNAHGRVELLPILSQSRSVSNPDNMSHDISHAVHATMIDDNMDHSRSVLLI